MSHLLPLWQCHKRVRAARVTHVEALRSHPPALRLSLEGVNTRVEVTAKWWSEKLGELGGYYVVYDDGYTSFSPAKAFEEGYTPIEGTRVVDISGKVVGYSKPGWPPPCGRCGGRGFVLADGTETYCDCAAGDQQRGEPGGGG
jgi:hypothetical protein